MAAIAKRGDAWRVRMRCQGQVLTRTFDTEAQAKAWVAAEETRASRGEPTPTPPKASLSLTVAELFSRYAREVSPEKDGGRWERIRLNALASGFPMAAKDVDGATMAEWRDARLKTVSAATVNRELNLISAVFTRAIKEWRLPLPVNPVHTIQRPKQPHHRTRRVSDQERADILKELGWNGEAQPVEIREWIAWGFCLALETMMRKGEILRLTWGHVHLDRKFCHLPKTKNGHPRNVPLSSRAVALFDLLKSGKEGERVVPVDPGTFGVYFHEAVKSATIEDLHFHDSRREALTRLSAKLPNIAELARASGHRGTRSLMIYYAPDVSDIAQKLD